VHINAHWWIKGVFDNLEKFVYTLGKNWQTRAWDPVFKTAGSAPDAAMILGLFSQKNLRLTLIVSYIELFIFILIFFVPRQNDIATTKIMK
jgi:hypothetical protein